MRSLIKILILSGLLLAFAVMADKPYRYLSPVPINTLFEQAIHDRAFPGGCLLVGTQDRVMIKKCYGYHTYRAEHAQGLDDLFDLASLTKVVGTTTAIMRLYEQHQLKLSDRVVEFLPEFTGPNDLHARLKATITIADLLAHRSGLHEPNDIGQMSAACLGQRWRCLLQTPLSYYPRRKMVYSDLNFILLGKIVEKITREPLDQYFQRTLFYPLAMHHTGFNPQEGFGKIIPTFSEHCVGIVHDPIARNLGGVAGHAGLFSTINDLQHFGQMLLNHGRYRNVAVLQRETIKLFSEPDALLPESSRALGWDTAFRPSIAKQQHQFSAGLYSDPGAIGHTGYTGTSLWISQRHGLYVVLLTNRVFAHTDARGQQRDRYWRQQIASSVWRQLGFKQQNGLYQEPRLTGH